MALLRWNGSGVACFAIRGTGRLLAVVVALSAVAPLRGDEPPGWAYSPALLRPFWEGNTVEGESVLFIKEAEADEARASVLFPVERIVSVRNSDGDVKYEEGRDYTWQPESREIVLPPGSRIAARTPQDMRRPANSQKYALTHRDGHGEIYFGSELEYHHMQTCITYQHAAEAWPAAPQFDEQSLPRALRKLRERQAVSFVLLGDSISAGCNASGWAGGPPYQPSYPGLLQQHLTSHFQTAVTVQNLSVGGTDTAWGLTQTDAVAAAQPDVVILAFGMNDSAGRSAEDYRTNIAGIMAGIRQPLPECEFILVAPMLGNRDWVRLQHERFPEYRDELAGLTQPGVALADLTTVWTRFLEVKQDWDLTGNGVNHPNDFGHRVYAQVLSGLFIPAAR